MSERKSMTSYLLSALFAVGLFGVVGPVSAHECPRVQDPDVSQVEQLRTINGDRFEWVQGD